MSPRKAPEKEGAERDIRRRIAAERLDRLKRLGPEEGAPVPARRTVPLVPFEAAPLLICEIKRRSPSKGLIRRIPDPAAQAGLYRAQGASRLSVLTESAHFGGSLEDLMRVKEAYPDMGVLRKDFLLNEEDIRVSHRAGADACLLIASLLPPEALRRMHDLCLDLGMTPLVEIHSPADAAAAAAVEPALVGINSRDLRDFRIRPLQPLKVRSLIDWECAVVYESGILNRRDGAFAVDAGFQGLLVGEGAVKNPALIGELRELQARSVPGGVSPWSRLYRPRRGKRPLVKVCGLTRREDADRAAALGADLLGFVLAPSPRRASAALIRSLPATKALKVGVVVLSEGEALPRETAALLEEGALDMIQFHGEEAPSVVGNRGYKALRIRRPEDLDRGAAYAPLPCLLDAFSPDAAGGTGKRLDARIVKEARRKGELWLAGGIAPENIREILEAHQPDLVDLSSGLETAPGIKSADKMHDFFREIDDYAGVS